jgi:hypothetical protein
MGRCADGDIDGVQLGPAHWSAIEVSSALGVTHSPLLANGEVCSITGVPSDIASAIEYRSSAYGRELNADSQVA